MFDIYEVQDGDNIRSIAINHEIDSSYLYKLNGFSPNCQLQTGERIIVPKRTSEYFDYITIDSTKSINELGKEYDVDVSLLSQLNGLNPYDYIYTNQTLIIPKRDVKFYITDSNDKLLEVIRGMNGNLDTFLKCNPNLYLREGQLIMYKEK